MRLRSRPLRTYSRRDGFLRLLPPPPRWLSPPLSHRNLFSSSSAASPALSAATSASSSAAPDDPDYSPPHKSCPWSGSDSPVRAPRLRPRRRRQRRARPTGTGTGTASTSSTDGDKENRPPHPAPSSSPSSPSPSPSPPPRRRRKGPCGARRPLLCSTPHGLGPAPGLGASPALGDSPPAGRLSELLLSTTIEHGLGPGLLPARRRRPLRPLPPSSPEEPQEPEVQCPPPPSSPQLPSEPLEPCPPPLLPPSSPSSPSCPPGPSAEPDVPQPSPAARPAPPQDAAPQPPGAPEELRGGPRTGRSARGGSIGPPGPAREQRVMVPVVVLDRGEVARVLASMRQGRKDGARAARPHHGSPVGQRGGIPENKPQRMQGAPGEGSACRRACISGSSASRWRTLRPKRRKLKRQKQQQQPENCFSRARARQKPAREGVLEMSAEVRGNDSSFLNSSCTWVRVRASLSFHKKKKVTTEDSFCSSILSTPSGKSPMSGYQASLSSGKTQGHSWCASSMVLLAPSASSSVLELMLTDAEKVFGECCQEGPIAFEECIPLDKMKNCKKIGEGVFGEVFQIKSERGPVALKIIPIEGTEKVNGEAQKSFGEILPEVIISKELSLLSEESVNRTVGFISLYSVHCVQGAYPKYLLKAWDKYHKETGSENDRPDFFGDEQLFMVLEFEFGGSDLEHMRHSLSSVAAARSILHQVTASLAVAEQELHFEHRDLHWGNVLVKKTDVKALHYVLNGAPHRIPTAGIHVNIIDYTLSRLEKDGLTVFCDLASEEELFQGTGDYQFDIYRQMKAENSNSWTGYHPHSNVLWLHYLADKLLHGVTYKNKASSSGLKNIKVQLTKFHKEVLSFKSAHDVLQNSSLFQ